MQEKPRELRTLAFRRYNGNCGLWNRPEKFRWRQGGKRRKALRMSSVISIQSRLHTSRLDWSRFETSSKSIRYMNSILFNSTLINCLVVRPAKFAIPVCQWRCFQAPTVKKHFQYAILLRGWTKPAKIKVSTRWILCVLGRGNIVNIQAVPTDEATRKSVHEFCRNSLVECENQFSLTE